MGRMLMAAVAVALALPVWAAELGDDGLPKSAWMRDTFKDLREDLAEASDEGKRLVLFFEQRGCIYCTKMHEEVFVRPQISQYILANYFVVQLNLHGDIEITDLDGEALTEKAAARKWRVMFTPTMLFLPEDVPEDKSAADSAVATMPGTFGPCTTLDMVTWVNEKRYALVTEEDFQRYHARMSQARDNGVTD